MEEESGLKEYFDAIRKRMEGDLDVDELIKMKECLLDVLIEIMPALINAETRIGKRNRLRRRFFEILAERHGV